MFRTVNAIVCSSVRRTRALLTDGEHLGNLSLGPIIMADDHVL